MIHENDYMHPFRYEDAKRMKILRNEQWWMRWVRRVLLVGVAIAAACFLL